MSEQPLDHILRVNPPWRKSLKTVCGRSSNDVASVVTRDEVIAKIKKDGKQRAAFTTCMTCATTSVGTDFWKNPIEIVMHGMNTWDDRKTLVLADELRALAQLVSAHPEEFAKLLETVQAGDEIAEARRKRSQQPNFTGLVL